MDTPDTFEKIRARADLKRVSSVEEVCATVKFLLAADSVTGQVISLSADAAKNA